MTILDNIILVGSILGIVNSLLLIIYAIVTAKGSKVSNRLFAFLVFSLTLRVSKSIILTYSEGIHDFLLTIGLSGFLAIGPAFYLYVKSIASKTMRLSIGKLLHLLPAVVFTFMWVYLDFIRTNGSVWHIFYRSILLHYMIYITLSLVHVYRFRTTHPRIYRDLNIISIFLLAIWLSYALNEVAGFPYISGAILYSLLIYFSIIILINKGHLIDTSAPKYAKSGIDESSFTELSKKLETILQDESVITDNTMSLMKLAKLMGTSSHAASQVINATSGSSFFDLLASKRISLACNHLIDDPELPISQIAYDVGYNSLSAFNTAFKRRMNLTPSQYRKSNA